ncbi:DCC1-like thiol-disulfide oxidoreductase family protein [Pedobacter metabolipauper]|uniref:Uncharacterized protein DUF393 n=1 Tax=Pedobacter metabolipauper TaxID=425513 RepID=A0A4R6SUE6_9SPHI|nr:DCC1-like thiol-disulfide oxidoreductase family protein [Pedobacter metabolipauper]TDQ08400.1 uncharacterized protein DUF393 [Pedobacter metabolipauper]
MKTLANHQILFDAECPMCRIYTRAIVSKGILDQKGRMAYQDLSEQACPMVDRQRAANEIALVNQETGEVTYGIHSLFKVFGVAVPALKPLFAFKPFVWLMSRLYFFISYNRRVIIPAKYTHTAGQIQPAFRLDYRIAYLLITWFITAFILSAYTTLMAGLLPSGLSNREYLVCGGQVFFQGIIIYFLYKNKAWDYLGNMMTISFAGALALLPGLIVAGFTKLDPIFYAVWFMAVAGAMFLEHIRRTRLLELGWTLTFTWLFYRVAILLLILTHLL